MIDTTQQPLLEVQTQLWKARAQVKQKLLDRILAVPAKEPQDLERRKKWIERALGMVRREQEKMKYQAALIDAYAAHLNVLEMNLLGATEQRPPDGGPPRQRQSEASPSRRSAAV
jgi:hypothetical protein